MSDKMNDTGDSGLVVSYLILRRAIGYLGLALPFVLSIGGYFVFGKGIQTSISSYYYTGMRDFFVGVLCAIGVFLLSYKGYERIDAVAGDLACVFGVGVALFPTSPDDAPTTIGKIHWILAALFLATLAYFSLCLFTKTDATKRPTEQKLQRNRVYRICGWLMVACLLLILIFKFLPESVQANLAALDPVYWLESTAILSFGVSWMVKGEAILKDAA